MNTVEHRCRAAEIEGWLKGRRRALSRRLRILALAAAPLAYPQGLPPGPPPGGFAGPPPFGPGQAKVELVRAFDTNGDHWLNAAERQAARASLKQRVTRRQQGPGGPPGGPGGTRQPGTPGPRLSPADVPVYPDASLYAPHVLRTFFLTFAEADWEKELEDFHGTDVDVAATLTVDGKEYPEVGVRFRGASSYSMVGTGSKRSLNVSLDLAHKDQSLKGFKTLNLLNSHEDPSFLRAVLYLQIARGYIPAPQANLVRVVINGESWGVYQNVEQFNGNFVHEWFGTTAGARWKVPGSPQGRGSLTYLGDEAAPYRSIYEIKSKDVPQSWADLAALCQVLTETPADRLEADLAPRLDIDGALWFLALENVLINNDGYWIRTSDYALYEDLKGCFHVIPIDVNETFTGAGGPGGGPGFGGAPGGPGLGGPAFGGPGGGPGFSGPGRSRQVPGGGLGGPSASRSAGVRLDPLVAVDASDRPLISKLLAVPALRARYLGYVRELAETWLDWRRLGPVAQQYHALIADAVAADTRKLSSLTAFQSSLDGAAAAAAGPGPGGRGVLSLRSFAEQRRAYLVGLESVRTATFERGKAP